MPCIWLDVTTIFGWHRPVVGVVRTEFECAAFALNRVAPQTRFCLFNASDRRYVEVSADEVRDVLARIRTRLPLSSSMNSPTNSITAARLTREQHLTAYIKRLIEMLPQRLRRHVFNFVANRKSAYQFAVRSYREARLAIREFLRPTKEGRFIPAMSSGATIESPKYDVPFTQYDIYISLGLDWDQKDLTYLYSQKRRFGFKVLLFCYDIIPVKFPHLCVGDVAAIFSKYFSDLAWCADKVLCISECSRRDLTQLLDELGTPMPQMDVVRLGCNISPASADDPAPDILDLLDRRYILYVATIERRKNHETLYRAYTRLIDSSMTGLPYLVFVGMLGWGVNDLLADLRLDPRVWPYIRILNYVKDSDLAYLYKNAYFTVLPSLYEGWGLPVAESLAFGKFCLASNAASIPEVGGDLVEYLDPWDVPAWTERIKWYIDHEADLVLREHQIKNKYKPVTWESCASAIFKSTIVKE